MLYVHTQVSSVMNTVLCAYTQASCVLNAVLFVHTQVLVCLLSGWNAKFIPSYLILVSFFFFLLLTSLWKFSSLSFKCVSHCLELSNSSK